MDDSEQLLSDDLSPEQLRLMNRWMIVVWVLGVVVLSICLLFGVLAGIKYSMAVITGSKPPLIQ